MTPAEPVKTGVVTTLDRDIQQICEDAAQQMERGAVVVMDVHSGDILAMVSRPDFDPAALGEALRSEGSPFVNRALNAYSVGSIFKLAIAASAIQNGISPGYSYQCTGMTQIYGQIFRCHRHSGHGIQNMIDATANSCNTYFISLVQQLSVKQMLETVSALGFGRETILCSSLVSAPGQVQTARQLSVPAELANFSFGQGKLTATPLQICMMTCAIAGDGSLPVARLVQGWTADGETCTQLNGERRGLALPADTARQVRLLMEAAVDGNPDSLARPDNTRAAGKTSTAQTGQYDADGVECCHAWITGYFPLKTPEYAVTVFVENGGSGNTAAAPIFRRIAEGITENITKKTVDIFVGLYYNNFGVDRIDCSGSFQRESGWCELLVYGRVLPLSRSAKAERMRCVKANEESMTYAFEFGWYHERLRPIAVTEVFFSVWR